MFSYSEGLLVTSIPSNLQAGAFLIKGMFGLKLHVASSLIEAYTQCGNLEDAEKVSCVTCAPDDVTFNAMIKAYSCLKRWWRKGYYQQVSLSSLLANVV